MHITYLCTYLDGESSQKLGFPYSAAGLRKKQTVIRALQTNHDVTIVSTIPFKRFKPIYYKTFNQSTEIGKVHFPGFSPIPLLNLFINTILSTLFMIRLHKQKPVDLLIVYNYSYNVALIALIFKFMYKTKLITQLEDGWALNPPFYRHLFLKMYFKLMKRFSDGLITNSYTLKEKFKSNNYCLIRGSIPDNPLNVEFLNDNKPLESADHAPINILYSSTIDKIRGAELLADYLSNITSQRLLNKTRFLITGRGDKKIEERIENAVEKYKSAGGKAEYYGFVSKNELHELVKNSHILLNLQNPNVVFSQYCFPSKIIDYMTYGKAIITTRVSDLQTHFDIGFKFIDYSIFSLQSAIEHFLDNVELINGHQYQEYVTSNFSISKYAEQLEKVVNECFNDKLKDLEY